MRHLDDGLLQAWLDRPRSGLEADEHDRIERHLADCEACAGRVADLRDATRRAERLLAPSGAADEPVPPYEAVVARARRSGAGRQRRRGWVAAGLAASLVAGLWGGWLAHGLMGPGPDGRSTDRVASAPAEGRAERAELAREGGGEAPTAGDTDGRPGTPVVSESPEGAPPARVAQASAGAAEAASDSPGVQEVPDDGPGTRVAGGVATEEATDEQRGGTAEEEAREALPTVVDPRIADAPEAEAPQARADLAGRPWIVQGRVTSESGSPLTAAQVVVEGSSVGSLTGPDGRFTLNLRELPDSVTRDPTITATLIGYGRESRTPGPQGGDTASLDFRLPENPVALNELVVTGAGAERAFAPRAEEAGPRDREREETPAAITVPWAGGAPAAWLPVRRGDVETTTGLPLLLVPGLEVVRVETARFEGFPVVRVVQELPGGDHLTLVEAATPVAVDGVPAREDLAVAYTSKDGLWIAGIARLSPDRLEALLERVR